MSITSVYAAATTALALALVPATAASAAGPGGHENTYPAPNGTASPWAISITRPIR